MKLHLSAFALALSTAAMPALAEEVNVYSHRQPELIQPLIDAFTAGSGIPVNIAFVDKGMVGQSFSGRLPKARDDVDDAFREACLIDQLS